MFLMKTAERVISTLRAHEAELQRAGLRSLSLFGSVARGETETGSDIDLAAKFDPAARMDLLQLTALERRIAVILGSPVDLLPEPVEKRRLQDQINRDRRRGLLSVVRGKKKNHFGFRYRWCYFIRPSVLTSQVPFSRRSIRPFSRREPYSAAPVKTSIELLCL